MTAWLTLAILVLSALLSALLILLTLALLALAFLTAALLAGVLLSAALLALVGIVRIVGHKEVPPFILLWKKRLAAGPVPE